MRFHQVHTVHNFHHVDKVHFIEHLTIDGQLRVTVGTGHFGGVAFARLPLTGIHFFVTSTHHKLHGLHFPGNFRNLFMYSPNGKKDGLQIIPLSEVAAKDEFLNIKNVSRDDMMAAHRVPPQMMGILPNNVGGFGDVEKASRVFVRNELTPLQKRLQELNDWLGEEVIKFTPYILSEE